MGGKPLVNVTIFTTKLVYTGRLTRTQIRAPGCLTLPSPFDQPATCGLGCPMESCHPVRPFCLPVALSCPSCVPFTLRSYSKSPVNRCLSDLMCA